MGRVFFTCALIEFSGSLPIPIDHYITLYQKMLANSRCLEVENILGWTPWKVAARYGCLEHLHALIDAGVTPKIDNSLLSYAIRCIDDDMNCGKINFLINLGLVPDSDNLVNSIKLVESYPRCSALITSILLVRILPDDILEAAKELKSFGEFLDSSSRYVPEDRAYFDFSASMQRIAEVYHYKSSLFNQTMIRLLQQDTASQESMLRVIPKQIRRDIEEFGKKISPLAPYLAINIKETREFDHSEEKKSPSDEVQLRENLRSSQRIAASEARFFQDPLAVAQRVQNREAFNTWCAIL